MCPVGKIGFELEWTINPDQNLLPNSWYSFLFVDIPTYVTNSVFEDRNCSIYVMKLAISVIASGGSGLCMS